MIRPEAFLLLIFGLIGSRLANVPGLDVYLTGGSETYYWGLTAQWWLTDLVSLAGFFAILFFASKESPQQNRRLLKIVIVTVSLLILIPTARHVITHQLSQPGSLMHDGTLQTEVAARSLLDGKNPYTIDYENTLFDFAFSSSAASENNAFTHFVYPPGMIALAIPFVWVADVSDTWVELPLLYVGMAVLAVWLVARRIVDPVARSRLLILTLGNPLIMLYPIAGYNDVVVISLLVFSVLAGMNRRWIISGVLFGLAIGVKQIAWAAIPLWLLWVWRQSSQPERRSTMSQAFISAGAISLIIYLPFLVWDAGAMFQDLIVFTSGVLPGSYPIAGSTLWQLKAFVQGPDHVWDSVPSRLPSLLVGGAILVGYLRMLWRSPKGSLLLQGTAIVALGIGLVHRFFHDNYLSALILLLLLANGIYQRKPQQS